MVGPRFQSWSAPNSRNALIISQLEPTSRFTLRVRLSTAPQLEDLALSCCTATSYSQDCGIGTAESRLEAVTPRKASSWSILGIVTRTIDAGETQPRVHPSKSGLVP